MVNLLRLIFCSLFLLGSLSIYAKDNHKIVIVDINATKDLNKIEMEAKYSDSAQEKYSIQPIYQIRLLDKKSRTLIGKKVDFVEVGDIVNCPPTVSPAKCEQPENFKKIYVKFNNVSGAEKAQLLKGKKLLAETKVEK